ncbi:MAG: autotransporter-associated beta strand repeat-containing protein [Planctomycetes bacterium]|nr:autotransporter-associated beta strand repeat-containing protein [Planctomycetota bacterium]
MADHFFHGLLAIALLLSAVGGSPPALAQATISGTVALSGTLSGDYVINAGAMMTGTASVDGPVRFLFLDLPGGQPATLAGDLGGTGSLSLESGRTLESAGTLVITGNNSYSGGTIVGGLGLLEVAAGGSISHATADFIVGSASQLGSLAITGGTIVNGNAIIGGEDGGFGAATMSAGTWSSTGALTVGGPGLMAGGGTGTLLITGGAVSAGSGVIAQDASSTGAVTVSGGTLAFGNGLAIGDTGSLAISGGGIVIVGGTLSRGSSGTLALSSGGMLQIGAGSTGGTLDTDLTNDGALVFDRSDDSTYGFVIDGGGAVTKRGAGTLTLTGVNTYTGTTTISGGALALGDGAATGSIAGDVLNDATLIFHPGGDTAFANAISGTGAVVIRGSSIVTLSGNNSWSGGTTLEGGVLSLGSADALGTTGTISFASGTLQYTAANTTDYSARINSAGGQSVFIDTNSQAVTFATGLSGAGTVLAKVGDGTLTLTATNTYTGNTIAFGGTLEVATGGAIESAGDLLVGTNGGIGRFALSGGTVQVANAVVGSDNGTGTVDVSDGSLTIATLLTIGDQGFGNGTLNLTGGSVTAGTTVLGVGSSAAGGLTVTSAGTFTATGDLTVGGQGTGVLSVNAGGTVVVGGTLSQGQYGTIDLGIGGTLRIGRGGTTGVLATDLSITGDLVFDRSDDVTYGGVINGAGTVTKAGAGTLTLTGTADWTGNTTITSGTLRVGDGATSGSLGGYVTNDAVLAFDRSDPITFAGSIDGYGRLEQLGSGTLTLTGSNGYSGGTTIAAGTLEVATGGVVNHPGAALSVAPGSTAALVISGGTVINADATIGDGAGADGSATITAGQWTNSGDLVVGKDGAAGLLAIQGGTVVVSGALTRGTGGTIQLAAGGTLQIGDGGSTGTLDTALVNDGSLVFDRSGTSTQSSVISGTGSVTKLGSGTLVISGANTYSGTTTIAGGMLEVVAGGAVDHGGTELVISSGTLQVSGGIVSNATGYVGYHGQGAAVVTSGSWSNAGDLRVGWGVAGDPVSGPGDGTLSISGGFVSNGGVYLGADVGSVGTALISGGAWQSDVVRVGFAGGSGSIDGSGGNLDAVALLLGTGASSSGTATVSGGTWAITDSLSVGDDGGTGVFTMTGGFVTSGTGLVGSLAGSIGTATVSGGTWATTGDMVVGNDGSGSLVIDGTGTVIVGGSLYKGIAGAFGSGGAITLASGGTLRIGSGGGNLATDLTNDGTLVFENVGDATYGGSIDGSGQVRVALAGGTVLTLSGTNSWTGGTALESGTLALADPLALGTTGTISFTGGTLQFSTANTVDYSPRFDASGGQAFSLDTNGQTVTLAGVIAGAGSALDKLGAGTLVLTADNTYIGLTTVASGSLQLGGGGTTGSVAGDVRNDAALAFNRSDSWGYGGVISGTGSLIQLGSGTLTLSGSNTFTGDTVLRAGTLALEGDAPLGTAGAILFSGGALQYTALTGTTTDYSARFATTPGQAYRIDTAGAGLVVTLGADLASSGGSLTKLGAGTLVLTGSNAFSGGVFLEDGILSLGSSGAIGPVDPSDPDAGQITFSGGALQFTTANTADPSRLFSTAPGQLYRIDANGQVVTLAADLNGSAASLTTLGSGTVTLSGSNAFAAGVALDGGTLALASAGALGPPDPAAGTITFGGGTLQFSSANTTDYSGRFSNAANQAYSIDTGGQSVTLAASLGSSRGSLEKLGAGTLTLTGTNTFTGPTTIVSGTLRIGAGGMTGSLTSDVANGGALVFERADTATYSGAISGTGSLTMLGTGTLTLDGNSTFSGATHLAAGTLALGSAGALGSGGPIAFGGGTLQYTAANQADYSGRISPAGGQSIRIDLNGQAVSYATGLTGAGSSLTLLGSGTLALSGSSDYSGGTSIGGGLLEVASGGAISHVSADLLVGTTDGDGAILVSGGTVVDRAALLGAAAGRAGTATVTSGTWTSTTDLLVGAAAGATGNLSIQGGTVTSGAAAIGFAVGSTGTATVSSGTWTNTGELRVGYDGAGALVIGSGGEVAVGGSLFQGAAGSIDLGPGGVLRIGLGGTTGELLTDLTTNGTLIFDRSDDTAYYNIVSGTGGLTKLGGGMLTLTGSQTYTGLTTISSGTLRLGDGTTSGALAGDVLNDAVFAFDTASTGTFSGAISGTGSVAKLGAGTLTLAGSNTYEGGTRFGGGTLVVGSADAISGTGTLSFDGGTLQYSGANAVDYSGRFSTAGNQAFAVDTAGRDVTFATGLSGAGSSLSKSGSGTLTLTGASTYDGLTTVSAGSLAIGDGGTSGSVAGDIANSSAVIFNRSDDVTFAGVMSGTGTLEKLGGGVLVLSGANTFTGVATIRSGTLQVGDGGTSGSIVAPIENDGVLAFNRSDTVGYAGSISGSGALLKLGAGTLAVSGSNGYSGGTTVGDGTLDVAPGGVIFHPDADLIVGPDGATAALTVTGGAITANTSIVGSEGVGTATVTAGTWTSTNSLFVGLGLTAAGNGAVVLDGGTLETGRAFVGTFPSGTGAMTVSSGTWINHGDLALGFSGGAGSLAIGGGAVSNVNASIGAGSSGSGAVTVTGGTWTTSGDVTVGSAGGTGALTISGSGTALVGGTLSRGDLGAITLSGGGTLQIGLGLFSGDLVGDLVNDGTLIFNRGDDSTSGASISGTGSLVKMGAGTLVLTGSNSYTGSTALKAGTLSLGSPDAIGTTGTVSFEGGTLQFTSLSGTDTDLSSRFSTAPGQAYRIDTAGVDVTLATPLVSSGGTLDKSGSGRLTITADATFTGTTTVREGTLQIGDGGSTGSLAGDIAVDSDLVFNRSGTTTYGGVIAGNGNVTKLGAGTLVLTAENLYFGTTTVTAGALQIGDGGTAGSIRGDVLNDGTLVFNRSDDVTFPGIISGTGAVTKLGAGTLTFTADSTYSGLTTIASGTLRLGSGGTSGSIAGDVVNDGVLVFDRSDSTTFAGTISGTGAVTKLGTGMLTLTGESTDAGPLTVTSGTLRIGAGGTNGAYAGDIVNGGALVFDRSDGSTYSGAVSGAGTVEKRGAGTLTLTGSNSFTGGTTITAGALQVGDGGTSGSLSGDVVVDGALIFNRGDVASFTGAVSGTGALSMAGSGTLVYTGDATHTGGTTISAGTLQIGAGGTAGSLLGNVDSVGTLAFDRSDTVTFSGTVSGAGGITQLGSGALVLLADNTYSGVTTIASGTVALGDGGVVGSIAGDVVNDGALVFDRSDSTTFAGVISGTGATTKAGAGTLSLTGESTATGPLSVTSGTLRIGVGGTTGSYAGAIVNSAAVVFDRSDDSTYAGVLSGAGTVEKLGAGTLTLAGESSGSGVLTIATGTVRIGVGGTTGSYAGDIVNDGTLVFDRSDSLTVGSAISGSGGLTKLGSGTVLLDDINTFTGTTSIAAGTLALSDSGGITASATIAIESGATLDVSTRSSPWQLGSGQTLTGAGLLAGPAVGAFGSTVNPGGVGVAGTLTATGGFTLLGGLTIDISGGTIDLFDGSTGELAIGAGSLTFTTLSPPTGNLVFAKYLSLTGGAFASVSGLPGGYSIDYDYLGGHQIALVQSAGVPEIDPAGAAAIVALLGGSFGMFERRVIRRRRGHGSVRAVRSPGGVLGSGPTRVRSPGPRPTVDRNALRGLPPAEQLAEPCHGCPADDERVL